VHFPDCRIEYRQVDGREDHLDVEVVTEHYPGAHGAAVGRCGFSCHRGSSPRIGGGGSRGSGGGHHGGLAEELFELHPANASKRNVESGCDVLRALLVGPLNFTPVLEARRRGYAFEGAIALDRLVSGVITLPALTGVASPAGTSPSWPFDFSRISCMIAR
jgi:hypothetical protein